jgi:hypothetical protein
MRNILTLAFGLAAALTGLFLRIHNKSGAAELPPIVLWAWQRPEDLRFLDPETVGVAYLAGTITLRGDTVMAVPRLQPLKVSAGTRLAGVVRIEADVARSPSMSGEQREKAVREILRMTYHPGVTTCQIDYDARKSERAFYADLIKELRHRLPREQRLSITALASWCMDDNWIAGLPIDEAVPMLFRMGPEDREVRRRLRSGRDFTDRACRASAGVSTDEPLPPLRRGRRVYIFHPRPWTQTAAQAIIRQVRSRQ